MRPTRRVTVICALVLAGGASACAPNGGAGTAASGAGGAGAPLTALGVDSALRAIADRPLWPGFEPAATPIAIYDGTRTWLFRHPHPPAGYAAVPGRSDAVVRVGRDPAVTANSSAAIDGVATATVLLRDDATDAATATGLAVHELFHVFQRARHPGWQANEVDLFTYPIEDTVALALRREEWSVLHRARFARGNDSLGCWTRAFGEVRRRRFAVIGKAAADYERGTELNEGLARFVEQRAGGRVDFAALDPAPAQVRERAYVVGATIAQLLDRFRPSWREMLERAPAAAPPLDSLLAEAAAETSGVPACGATTAQRDRWASEARADVRAIETERDRARAEFLHRPGTALVLESGNAPMFPAGFDPLNVSRLSPTEILHTRFLKLQGPRGTLEMLGRSALTEGGAGAHPLFAGVRRVTLTAVTGLAVRDSAGVLAADAAGVSIRLRNSRADTAGSLIRLTAR